MPFNLPCNLALVFHLITEGKQNVQNKKERKKKNDKWHAFPHKFTTLHIVSLYIITFSIDNCRNIMINNTMRKTKNTENAIGCLSG